MTSLMPRANRAPIHPVKSYARTHQVLEPSNLVNIQLESFEALKTIGIREVLDEINPVQDVTGSNCASARTTSAIPAIPKRSAARGRSPTKRRSMSRSNWK